MIFALITFMGFWWWLLTIIAVIAITAMSEEDMWFPGLVVLLGWLLIVSLLGDMPAWQWFNNLTLMGSLKLLGSYLGIGLAWSYFKWFTKLRKFKNKYNELKVKWDAMSDEEREGWSSDLKRYLSSKMDYTVEDAVRFKKDGIIFWIVFFPFSMLNFFLKDLMRFIVEDILKGTYIKMKKMVLGESIKYAKD